MIGVVSDEVREAEPHAGGLQELNRAGSLQERKAVMLARADCRDTFRVYPAIGRYLEDRDG